MTSDLLIGVGGSLLAMGAIWLFSWTVRRVQRRGIRSFWGQFLDKRITIVFSDYPILAGTDATTEVVRRATGGELLSRGNALALVHLMNFLPRYVTKSENISVMGGRSGVTDYEHLILVGSSVSNELAAHLERRLADRFDGLYHVEADSDTQSIGITSFDGTFCLTPTVVHGNGEDYAAITKVIYRSDPERYAVFLSGAYMYGVEAAAYAVTNRHILNRIRSTLRKCSCLTFLINTTVLNGHTGRPELQFGNRTHIHSLTKLDELREPPPDGQATVSGPIKLRSIDDEVLADDPK